jgi:hypothetical protein
LTFNANNKLATLLSLRFVPVNYYKLVKCQIYCRLYFQESIKISPFMNTNIFYHGKEGVVLELSGEFCFDSIRKAFETIISAPPFSVIKYWIIDRSKVNNYDMTSEGTQLLAELCINAAQQRPPLAHLLVSPKSVAKGMSNVYRVHLIESGWQLQHFETIDQAMSWLKDAGLSQGNHSSQNVSS